MLLKLYSPPEHFLLENSPVTINKVDHKGGKSNIMLLSQLVPKYAEPMGKGPI